MTEEQIIKKAIAERLKNAPRYPANCQICGKYAATFTRPVTVVHFDCWQSRRRPQRVTDAPQ